MTFLSIFSATLVVIGVLILFIGIIKRTKAGYFFGDSEDAVDPKSFQDGLIKMIYGFIIIVIVVFIFGIGRLIIDYKTPISEVTINIDSKEFNKIKYKKYVNWECLLKDDKGNTYVLEKSDEEKNIVSNYCESIEEGKMNKIRYKYQQSLKENVLYLKE